MEKHATPSPPVIVVVVAATWPRHEVLNTYQNVELGTDAEELGGNPEPEQQNPHQESTDQDPDAHTWNIQVN